MCTLRGGDVPAQAKEMITVDQCKIDLDQFPDVFFQADIARLFRVSVSTIERRRREKEFPIPQLPALDRRPRWAKNAVIQFLQSSAAGATFKNRLPGRLGRRSRTF
jgi:hypothetical protein